MSLRRGAGAVPAIQAQLGVGREQLQLVVTAYAFTFGALLLGRRAAYLYERRRMFLSSLLFTLASLVCGLTPTGIILVFGRGLRGIGGALMASAALALLTSIYAEGPEHDRALGLWSTVAAVGGAAGLLLFNARTEDGVLLYRLDEVACSARASSSHTSPTQARSVSRGSWASS